MFRRDFLKNTSFAAAGGLFLPETLLAERQRVSANGKINFGLIGCKGMGWSNLKAMLKVPDAQCVALCDIDQSILDQRKAELDKIGIKPQLYGDYRKLLENKDIDFVIIGTPDHWHCLQMVDACAAGKDVYVEKPAANSIGEVQLMLKAAKRYDKIVQVNQWQRSQNHFNDAVKFVQSGKLGKIMLTKTWMYRKNSSPLPAHGSVVPSGVNYDMWLGPAQKRAFNSNRFHYEFRWFWDYAGGLMTDWGVHLIDLVIWAMKADAPKSVMASGGKYIFADERETPDTLTAVYDYGDFSMTWEHTMAIGNKTYQGRGDHGIAFIGQNGTLFLDRGGWEVVPQSEADKPRMEAVAWQKQSDNGLEKHCVNFVEALKARKAELLNCPIEAGARVAMNAHMGNMAYRVSDKIHWDATKNTFAEKPAAQLVVPEYHNGWKLPKLS